MSKKEIAVIAGISLAIVSVFVYTRTVKTADVTIFVSHEGFEPREITIKRGQVVAFTNKEPDTCTAFDNTCYFWPASDPHPTHEFYSDFDPREALAPGETWYFDFKKKGTWGFHDHFNAEFTGTIMVTD